MSDVGVALFSSVGSSAPGFACVHGEEVQKFNTWTDLPQDVRWLSNVDYRTHKEMGLQRVGNVHDAQYLRTNLSVLRGDYGEKDHKRAAELLAGLAHRTVHLGRELLGAEPDAGRHYRYAVPVNKALRASGYSIGSPGRPPKNHVSPTAACWGAWQINQKRVTPMGDAPLRYFAVPAQALYRWALTQPYPANEGTWEVRTGDAGFAASELDEQGLKGIERLVEIMKDHAGFARVRVISPHPDYAEFAMFGAGADGVRDWATLPETLSVARYANVQVIDLMLTDYAPLDMPRALRSAVEEGGEFLPCASFGLLLENIAAAYAARDSRAAPSPVACYLHSYLRAWMLDVAFILEQCGVKVGSYSYGRLVGRVDSSVAESVARSALMNGIIPPGWGRA